MRVTSSILIFHKALSLPNIFTHHYLYLYCDFHQIFSCPLLPVSLTFASASPSCLKKLGLSNDDDGDDNGDHRDNDDLGQRPFYILHLFYEKSLREPVAGFNFFGNILSTK